MRKRSMLAGILLGLSSSASATLFDFGASEGNSSYSYDTYFDEVTMTVDGIGLSIKAFDITNPSKGNITSLLYLTSPGGVWMGSDDLGASSSGTSTQIDGDSDDTDEGLLFTFSEAVVLNWINFDSFNEVTNPGTNEADDDGFNLTVDGVTLMTDVRSLETRAGIGSWMQPDQPAFSNISGTSFLVWADDTFDTFRIDRMDVSAVPEPALLSLMAIGLAGIRLASQRRTA